MASFKVPYGCAGHIDHSARVMRVITWNRSFKGMPDVDDYGKDDFDSEENETHATVLDKLLAWEKKLYDEVKVCCRVSLAVLSSPVVLVTVLHGIIVFVLFTTLRVLKRLTNNT